MVLHFSSWSCEGIRGRDRDRGQGTLGGVELQKRPFISPLPLASFFLFFIFSFFNQTVREKKGRKKYISAVSMQITHFRLIIII